MTGETVYIAGPYSQGGEADNVRKAVLAAEQLLRYDFVPYVPHLTHFWHLMHPHPVDFWYEYDLHWLAHCDILLRLPGASNGADQEEIVARVSGLPVYHSVIELVEHEYGSE